MMKQWVLKALLTTTIIFLFIGAFNYTFDPLQQYRASTFYKPHFTNARYLTPGLAKNYPYDSVIVGSSMTENFIISNVKEIIGFTHPIKFTSGGTTAHELKLILEVAFKHKNIQNVLYGLDFYAFSGDKKRLLHGKGSLPLYLYDDNYLNDYKYIFNIDTTKVSLKTTLIQSLKSKSIELNYNKMFEWQHRYKPNDFNETKVLRMWNNPQIRFNKNFNVKNFSLEKLKQSFEYNLLSLIKKHPQTTFYIFYPPYSILAYIDAKSNGSLKNILMFKKYIFNELSKYKNVKLYDFQVAKEVTFNLNNYRDLTHYHQKTNHWILECIKNDQYLITSKTIENCNTTLEQQVAKYSKQLEKDSHH